MSLILPPPPVDPCASTLPPPLALDTIKQCRCGAAFTHSEWDRLPFIGHQPDFEGGLLELRNCPCHSTIAVRVVS